VIKLDSCKACEKVNKYLELKKHPESMSKINWRSMQSITEWEKNNPKDAKAYQEANLTFKEVTERFGVENAFLAYEALKPTGKLWGTYSPNATEQEKIQGHFFNIKDVREVLETKNLVE